MCEMLNLNSNPCYANSGGNKDSFVRAGLVKITQTPPIGGMRAAPAGHDGAWFERSIKWGLGIWINEMWLVIAKPPS